jgi:DNA-directed RNA polymerase subunit RPC12/RpoP
VDRWKTLLDYIVARIIPHRPRKRLETAISFVKQLLFLGLCARIWKMLRFAGILRFCESGYTHFHEGERLDEVLGWPGYKVYRAEIDERAKRLKLWVRRKRGNKQLVCSGCGQLVSAIAETYEREVRDLPCFEYLTTVVIELYRLRCPDCGVKVGEGAAVAQQGSVQQAL